MDVVSYSSAAAPLSLVLSSSIRNPDRTLNFTNPSFQWHSRKRTSFSWKRGEQLIVHMLIKSLMAKLD
ncbi:hypothetical protein MKX01_007219 [Papaver californicum]|nr:hypothetical protein MKX01_007219 [Papaver californicum]